MAKDKQLQDDLEELLGPITDEGESTTDAQKEGESTTDAQEEGESTTDLQAQGEEPTTTAN